MSQFLVTLTMGKTAVVDTHPKPTVVSLKKEVSDREGCDAQNLILVWHSKIISELPDDVLLRDLGVQDLDVIQAFFKSRNVLPPSIPCNSLLPLSACTKNEMVIKWSGWAKEHMSQTIVSRYITLEELYATVGDLFNLPPNAFDIMHSGHKLSVDNHFRREREAVFKCLPFVVVIKVITTAGTRKTEIASSATNFMNLTLSEAIMQTDLEEHVAEWRLFQCTQETEAHDRRLLYQYSRFCRDREIRQTHHNQEGRGWQLWWDTRMGELFPLSRDLQTANQFEVQVIMADFTVRLTSRARIFCSSATEEDDLKAVEMDEDEAEDVEVVLAEGYGHRESHSAYTVGQWLHDNCYECKGKQDQSTLFYGDTAFEIDTNTEFGQLADRYNPAASLSRLHSFKFQRFDRLAYNSEQCVICLDDMNTEPIGVLPCRHIFHFDCIETQSRHQNSCPQCRQRFERMQKRSVCQETGMVDVGLPEKVGRRHLDVDSVATVWCLVCGANALVDAVDVLVCFRCRGAQHVGCVNTDMRIVQCQTCALAIHGECLADMNMFHDAVIYESSWECWRCNGTGNPEEWVSDEDEDDDDEY